MLVGPVGIVGFVMLIADVWAIVSILQSGASVENKVLWVVLVLILPALGFFFWLLAGPRAGRI